MRCIFPQLKKERKKERSMYLLLPKSTRAQPVPITELTENTGQNKINKLINK